MSNLIGLVGFIGSGKGTVGDILRDQHGYKLDSFAAPLKDAAAAIFGWDRKMLEGDTKESRAWREEVDEFWSQAFGKPFTPRLALQQLGTEACRNGIHKDIWTASLFKRALGQNTVVSDCRFPNEVEGIHKEGGLVIWVRRGTLPEWWNDAVNYTRTGSEEALKNLEFLGVHESERAWVGLPVDITLFNDGTLPELEHSIQLVVDQLNHNPNTP